MSSLLLPNAGVYLCGGAVRDSLLGIEAKDKDWVVTGLTPAMMLALSFEQVGASFPVFLHPETREEYALARTERKTGVGYHGFETSHGAEVTIEQDLIRRDLTINSMAIDSKTQLLIDPYGGLNDLKEKVLRHTSDAFADDPLRVLRLARFYARFEDFTVAPETLDLATKLVSKGELDELPDERFLAELEKVFTGKTPVRFFELLLSVGAISKVSFFRRLFFAVPEVRLRAAVKAATSLFEPKDRLPALLGLLGDIGQAVKLPSNISKATSLYCRFIAVQQPSGRQIVRFLEECRALNAELELLTQVCNIIDLAQKLNEQVPFDSSTLKFFAKEASLIRADAFPDLFNKELGEAIQVARAAKIDSILKIR